MKAKKLLALLLAVVFVVTQFAMLGTVSAATALTGRDDFSFGINIHCPHVYAAYTQPYNTIFEAKALGANLVRTNATDEIFDKGFAELAAKQGIDVMFVKGLGHINGETGVPYLPSEMDYNAIYESYYNYALAMKDHAKYIQIGNEMCNGSLDKTKYTTGASASEYHDLTGVAIAVYVANKAIHDAAPNVKTIVNFSWKHYGFLEGLKAVKIDTDTNTVATDASVNTAYADWDVTGVDIYADSNTAYADVIPTVISKFGKQVIVCETGLWPDGQNEDGSINYLGDAAWLETFATFCYNNSNVIGFVPYELYDEPAYSADGYHKESHYGFIDKDGNKKPIYDTLCGLYGGTGVVADRTIPEAPAIATEGELKATLTAGLENGDIGTVPTTYGLREIIYRDGFEAADFSQGNFVEFDFYVEDAEAFKTALARKNLKMQVILYNENTAAAISNYLTTEDIVVDGWNHITIAKEAFYDIASGSPDWSQFVKFTMRIAGGSDVYTELSGMNVAVANICSTLIEAPANDVDDSRVVLDEAGLSFGANRRLNWSTGFLGKSFNAVNISECDSIEFDFYVENYETFKTMTTNRSFVARFQSHQDMQNIDFNLEKYVTKQGWNHITLKLSKADSNGGFNPLNVVRYRFYFTGDANGSVESPAHYFMVKNINGVKSAIGYPPEAPEYAEVEISKVGITNTWGAQYPWTQDNLCMDFSANPIDITSVSNIEFDIYIEDCAAFQNMVANTGNHPVYLSVATEGKWGRRARYTFADQVTKDGWNHIVLNKNKYATGIGDNTPNFANVMFVYLNFWDNTGNNPLANTQVRIANIYGCPGEIDRIPAAPEYAEVEIRKEGLSTPYGAKYNYTGDNTYNTVGLFDAIDISGTSNIEFDFYVDSVENFKAMDAAAAVRFVLHTKERWSYRAVYIFADQVTKDGWNHIVLKKADTSYHETPDFTQVVSMSLCFWGGHEVVNPYSADSFKIANVYGCPAEIDRTPATPANATVEISKNGATHQYGNQYNWMQDRLFVNLTASPVDISSVSNVEFDVYIESIDDFKTLEYPLYFALSSATDRGAVPRARFNITDQITKTGWNHIVVSKYNSDSGETPDYSAVKWAYLTFWGGGVNVDNPLKDTTVRIANIYGCATELDRPPVLEEANGQLILGNGVLFTNKYKSTANAHYFNLETGRIALKTYDYLEFDYYVEDIAHFKETVTSLSAYVIHESQNHKAIIECIDKITENGWNHVKVALPAKDTCGCNWYRDACHNAGFKVDVSGESSYLNELYAIANVTCTAYINAVPDAPTNAVHTVRTDSGVRTYPAKFEWLINDTINNTAPYDLDFTLGDYIEFDYYIDSYEEFQAMIAAGGELRFCFGSTTADWGSEVGYIAINEYITKDGWNHVKVALGDLVNLRANSNPNLSSIKLVSIRFANSGDASTWDNTRYRYANLCVTADVRVPTDVMADKVDFIGAKLQSVKFDADGMYAGDVTADISATRMIELDVYVEDDMFNAIDVMLVDANENYVTYSFDNLTTGWNHLAVRRDDYTEAEGDIDFANIVNYFLMGDSGAKVFVSNFYAADYIDGDANRDGVINLKDVVRAKKLNTGYTTEGNRLAITGNDYVIDGSDLVAVCKAIIAALFK